MKMASRTSLKKFTIQTIINPGTFWAIENGNDTQNENNLNILQGDIKKFKHLDEISVGQIVAVKHEGKFHRGLITDIYNRRLIAVYCIWLVDTGKNIEISADSIFMIRTSQLRDKKLNAFEIVVHGIQPVTIELLVSSVDLVGNINRSNFDGILHKRESNSWSPGAFKFSKSLFESNKCIYVKCIDINCSKISGDVYYEQEGNGKLISLAQTLCDNDFAVFSQNETKIAPLDDYQGSNYIDSIERRIPDICKKVEWEELGVINSKYTGTRNKFSSGNISNSFGSNKSSSSNSKDRTNHLETSSFSPSWIIKKMDQYSPSTSSGSFKSSCQNIEQTDKLPSPKVSLLRIVQRNMQLYDKHK